MIEYFYQKVFQESLKNVIEKKTSNILSKNDLKSLKKQKKTNQI